MASRDGVKFKRWNEAFLRPRHRAGPGAWHYGHQYIAWHVVETKSALAGCAQRAVVVRQEKVTGPAKAAPCDATRYGWTVLSR